MVSEATLMVMQVRIGKLVIVVLLIITLGQVALASTINNETVNVWFFYASWCPHCHRVLSSGVLDTLPEYANVSKFQLDKDQNARDLFKKVVGKYGIVAGVPTVVVFTDDPYNGTVIQGDEPIIKNLPSLVVNASKNAQVISSEKSVTKVERNVVQDVLLVLGTSAADSINPCIMSVLALLLATIASIKAYRRVVKLGVMYILSVYLSYLAIGLLLMLGAMLLINQMSFLASQIATVTKMIVAVLVGVAGIINIKDFIWYGKGISFKLPERHKERIIQLAKRATIPAIISIAVIVTIVEFPCSGMMYLGLITYFVSSGVSPFMLLVYLLLYNVVFVLPLAIMVGIVSAGKKVEEEVSRIDKIRLRYRRWFRLIMGLALLGLAYLVLVV